MDFQFEEALVNLLAYWISEQSSSALDAPEIMYRLGWLLDRGAANYGNIVNPDIADILKGEARRRGYEPPKELQ